MKKTLKLFAVTCLSMCILLCGCGKSTKILSQPLDEVMSSIYKNIDEDKLPMALANTEITDDIFYSSK